jgi:TRAP transporter 4TM/12TM fusion protein
MVILANPAKLGTWFSVGARRVPEGWASWIIALSSAALTLYVLLYAAGFDIDPWLLAATFLSASLALCFVMIGAGPTSDIRGLPWWDMVLTSAAIAVGAYCVYASGWVHSRIPLMDALGPWDIACAAALLLLLIEATRRVLGLAVMTIVLVFLAYALIGHRLGGTLSHGRIVYDDFLDAGIFTTDGMLGLPVVTAAKYAFLFMLFGTILRFARGGAFFCDLATAIAGRWTGAPAKIAVMSSGLYGTVAGSAALDVVATGANNIPMMKRHGYHPAQAGAIELTAAAGGSIMPPAMGSAAFVMMAYAGLAYRELAAAAILPALLYYVAVYAQVHFQSLNHNPDRLPEEEIPRLRTIAGRSALFVVPIVALTAGLLADFAPNRVAVFGIVTALFIATLRKATRLGWLDLLRATADTVLRMMPVTIACAAAGLLISVINVTGLGPKFAEVIYALTGENTFMALVIAAVLTTMFGMGMPTPAAYILAAVLMGPVLSNLGVPDLAGNMFLLCFAAMSSVTPPIAAASYIAAAIAHSDALRISIRAVRFALAAFVMPFAFVASETLLMVGPPWRIALDFVTAGIGFVAIAAALETHPKLATAWWERLLLGAGGLFFVAPDVWTVVVGTGLAAASLVSVRLRAASQPKTMERRAPKPLDKD